MKVGILGGGQLAKMLALAGHPLGCEFIFFSPDPRPCAAPLGRHIRAEFDDEAALERLAQSSDVITCEQESIPALALRLLAQQVPLRPGPEALLAAQDRLLEKELFAQLRIPVAPYRAVDSPVDLVRAVDELGLPAVLKTRRQGYDGKGQAVLRRREEMAPAWQRLGGQPAILEALIPFDREISVIAARGCDGQTACYPVSENVHHDGILRIATCRPNDPMQGLAEAHVHRLLSRLDYVGVLALEFFQVGNALLANEFAPRVHNSGHWTIEGTETSQFENHLRAVLDLPLGSTALNGVAATVNFIGALPSGTQVLRHPGAHLHVYGKSPRPGRKVGHATVRADSRRQLHSVVPALFALATAAES